MIPSLVGLLSKSALKKVLAFSVNSTAALRGINFVRRLRVLDLVSVVVVVVVDEKLRMFFGLEELIDRNVEDGLAKKE